MTRQSIDAENRPHEELPEPFRAGVAEILAEPVPEVNLTRLHSRLAVPARPDDVRRTWRPLIAKIAWAGAVAAVFVMVASRSTPTSNNVWAQAVEQVRQARSLTYTQSLMMKGQAQPVKVRYYIAADGRMRSEQSGVTTIFGPDHMIRITLLEQTKTAIVPDAPDVPLGKDGPSGFVAWLETLKQAGDKPDKELGQKELDGKKVTGFIATQGNFTFTMWVDNASGNPVRIEYEPNVKGAGYEAVVMTDLRFDQKLDESLFNDAAPEGYSVMAQPKLPVLPAATLTNGEENVVKALRGYTKRSGGKFPASVADWGPWAVLFSQPLPDGASDPEMSTVMSHLGAITPFLSGMSKEDYEYLGDGKTVEDHKSIVFWFKQKNGKYRAIYGDFSAKDLAESDLPKK